MKLANKIKSGIGILENRLIGSSNPIGLRWNLTYRCNLDCSYCNLPEKGNKREDLSLKQIKNVLRDIKDLKVKRISYSGGEPLLRDDIGEIISYTKKLGISPTMNTNGTLISDNISKLKDIETLKVSLDGSKKTHNKLRGAFEETIEGIETAIRNNIHTTLCTTLSKENYREIFDLIELAEKYDTKLSINRVTNLYDNFEEVGELLPERKEIRKTMEEIIEIKKEKPEVIRNSKRHLKLIRDYPDHEKVRCTAGKQFCIILPDGRLTPCDRINIQQELPNLKNNSFKEAYEELETPECNGCGFSASMELNYLYYFKWDILPDLFDFLRKKAAKK